MDFVPVATTHVARRNQLLLMFGDRLGSENDPPNTWPSGLEYQLWAEGGIWRTAGTALGEWPVLNLMPGDVVHFGGGGAGSESIEFAGALPEWKSINEWKSLFRTAVNEGLLVELPPPSREAQRMQLRELMINTSESRWSAGWVQSNENILWHEGGLWRAIGQGLGEWCTWNEDSKSDLEVDWYRWVPVNEFAASEIAHYGEQANLDRFGNGVDQYLPGL